MHETIHGNELTSPGPPDAVDPLRYFRGLGLAPALSSEGLGGRAIKAERYRYSLREAEQPPYESHLLALVLRPFRVERHREGRVEKLSHAPGDVALVSAGGPATRWIHEEEVDMLILRLDPAFVKGVAEEIGTNDRSSWRPCARDPLIERIGLSLKAELEAGGAAPGGELYAESLDALAVHLLRERSSLGWSLRRKAAREEPKKKGGLSARALKQALEFIGDNLASDLSLAEIASAANLSPYHFSRLFKLSTGLSPHRYVVRERVEKAKELLSVTEMAVGEVALACGFSHQAHLSGHFGRLVGTSPKKFRQ